MKASQRRQEILRLTSVGGPASVDELASRFEVTASTIRRDLARLSEDGRLARTYGGAMVVREREQPLRERSLEQHAAKVGIGRWAADVVRDGDAVLLDAGTTTAEIARALRGRSNLVVATTGLTPLAAISGVDGIDVICLGGRLREISQGFIGPITEAALEVLTFDSVFFGADGVTAERGICEATLEQTRLKELMWRSSRNSYVVVHAAKLGHAPFNAWVRMPATWTLVTDDAASESQLSPFRARGISVVVVDHDGHQLR